MKKPASNLPGDQPIATLKRKQPAAPQKRTSKKSKAASSKHLKSLADAAIEVPFLLIFSIIQHTRASANSLNFQDVAQESAAEKRP